MIALSGCRGGRIPALLKSGQTDAARRAAETYAEIFGKDHFYLELQHHQLPAHELLCERLQALGRATGLPLVATGNVHYAAPDDRPLQDVLTCIRHHVTLDGAADVLYPNAERYLWPPRAMVKRFARYGKPWPTRWPSPSRCTFSLDKLPAELPAFPIPHRMTPQGYLRHLVYEGARERYGELSTVQRAQLEHELTLIGKLNLAGYFLIVWDITRFCREHGILCQGRGSAANSAVCYCLGITAVDPIKLELLFERFLSEERAEPPDIDIDIANNRREEAIQYVYDEVRPRSCRHGVRGDLLPRHGRPCGRSAKSSGSRSIRSTRWPNSWSTTRRAKTWPRTRARPHLNTADLRVRHWLDLAAQIHRFPRHLGIHVGGMIITRKPLAQLVPIENATMPDAA